MRALGAELDLIPSVEGPPKVTVQDIENMVGRAAELAAQPGHYATNQFNNPYIIPSHRDRLGREIWEQTEGRVTGFCHGLGSLSRRAEPRYEAARRVCRAASPYVRDRSVSGDRARRV
jgi:cysteine synthase